MVDDDVAVGGPVTADSKHNVEVTPKYGPNSLTNAG